MHIIADNIQITNPLIAKALDEMDPLPVQDLAKKCEAAGADILDINPGPLTRDGEEKMSFLVEAVQQVCNLPLSLDTSNPSAMAAGTKASREKPVINGFSLEPAKLEKILPLAAKFDCDIIGFLLYPNGMVPGSAEERLNLAVQLFEEFNEKGIEPQRLIIDPALVPLMWEDGSRQAMEILTVIRMLTDLIGFPVRTIVGLSNLTSGKGPKEKKLFLEAVYLSMLASVGLDMVLMNIFNQNTVSVVRACDSITRQGTFSWEEVP
ncbi:MAG: dihydropteroate synthase [Deltaproteobacteria bacterium]|nr:dihydropteroate synthase [Deltaproteobacteria bacterium]MBW2344814.1 dihydropteroate synthase [Deltaproteobacteria bacterium]